jgi:2,3-dihydroxybenzoate decarboxylase
MQGKIAFEEHFAVEETFEETRAFAGDSAYLDDFNRQILDLEDERLGHMDATGI